ncbi:MAG TPA: YdcF family protein, partial [Cyclobacteriaceae bacterium]
TLQLYKMGLISKILVSGGSGRLLDIGEHEANDLSDVLILMGVNPADIVVESDSRNTHESAVEIRRILENRTQPGECLLITSAFHMRRSLGVLANAGWKVDAFSTDFLTHPRVYTFDVLFIPKLEAMNIWHHLIKETVGYAAYYVVGYI